MKIAEYKQMMDWRRRVGFNGGGYVKKKVLPKKKPEEEVKKRKLENFEKAKPALENPKEVKEMIDKPKRGLVDEPGSYSGELPKSLSDLTEVFGNKIRLKSIGENAGKIALTTSDATAGYGTKYYDNNEAGIKKLRKIAENAIARNNPRTSEKALKNIKEFEERTGLKHKDFSVTSQMKIEKGNKNVGRNILIKKFEESKEGQKIIKDFEEKTGKKYKDQPDASKKPIREKTYTFKKNIPFDDPIRFKEIKNFINNTKKTFGYLPTRQEIGNHFLETKGIRYDSQIDNYVNKTKIKLPKGQGAGAVINLNNRIKKLLKSKTITNILNEGRFPTNSIIKNVLKVDPTVAADTAFEFAKTLTGEREIRLFKSPTKYKKTAEKYVTENIGDIYDPRKRIRKERGYYERGLTKLLNLPKNISRIRLDIIAKLKKIIPDMKNLSVDEIGSITTSMRAGSGPYAIFGQVIDKDFNTAKGSFIDAKKGILEQQLINLAKNNPERLRLQKNYNERVDQFEFNANKNNPIKKVKGLKLSFKPPSETVKNKKVYNQYKDLFDAHYDKYGYSFEVPADRDSIVDISKKLDNKAFQSTIKNRFKTLLGKGGKFGALIGAGTLAGTGFAFADQPGVQEATSVLPTAAGAGAGAAAVGTKTGRSLLGKAFRAVGTPLAGAGFAGTNVYSKMKEGQSLADAVVDPITGLELSFPGLFKENLKKIIPERFQGRAARFGRGLLGLRGIPVGPIGLTLAGLGQAQEFYNQYQDLQRMKEQNPRAYSKFMESRQTPALNAAEQAAIEDMGRSGAAGGGIMKMAGKSSGRPPESGPTPQGLDFLVKRGR